MALQPWRNNGSGTHLQHTVPAAVRNYSLAACGLKLASSPTIVTGMSKFSAADLLQLPVSERLQLVEEIWDSIAEAPEALELSNDDKRLIDERLEARRKNPGAGSPWAEVYARITARTK
jgi:putative addiction module component (TIGR02574 family)